MPAFPPTRQVLMESVIFWPIALVLFSGRIWSRTIARKSISALQADDYVMVFTFLCYTSLLIFIQVSAMFGTNEIGDASQLAVVLADPRLFKEHVFGSKIVVASNQCYLFTLWGVKACLLTLYYGLTHRCYERLFVKFVIGYTLLAFAATEMPLFIICRPFSAYWSLPSKNLECSTYHTYCIFQTVFNISSDILLLCIPAPLIVKVKAPPVKKAVLVCIFSLGVFTVMAASLNKYYNFTLPNTEVYMVWHIREASTSVMVANLMCWWPLLKKTFGWRRFVQSWGTSSGRARGMGVRPRTVTTGRKSGRGELGDVDLERMGSGDPITGIPESIAGTPSTSTPPTPESEAAELEMAGDCYAGGGDKREQDSAQSAGNRF
ncbi:hypothetical protein BCR34DRAFT_98005 [Clohesyomyces aquaticus]|uniref:Rhodopsin domain-containing protein n=1 Tax=Clohesyomyces aquaticus TaxID=1231657 RepID=A0A1Y1YUD1_9PLEO|nr:hypothetical protein BCR34DRAFT_98005 [Clohesyomyces aquaticus]